MEEITQIVLIQDDGCGRMFRGELVLYSGEAAYMGQLLEYYEDLKKFRIYRMVDPESPYLLPQYRIMQTVVPNWIHVRCDLDLKLLEKLLGNMMIRLFTYGIEYPFIQMPNDQEILL